MAKQPLTTQPLTTQVKKPKRVRGVRMRFKPTGKIIVFKFWKIVEGVVCYSDDKPVDLSNSMFEPA